jgi:hypothetical protein
MMTSPGGAFSFTTGFQTKNKTDCLYVSDLSSMHTKKKTRECLLHLLALYSALRSTRPGGMQLALRRAMATCCTLRAAAPFGQLGIMRLLI